MERIFEKIRKLKAIALIGNSKNSGKTTTLNFLLDNFKSAGVITIGLDGESKDLLYGNFKPKVRIHAGQVVCTSKEQLKHDFEIIERVKGKELYIAKALTDSDIMIVNPGGKDNIEKVISKMLDYVDTVFIDGAFDRIFSLSIVNGVILCVGAADDRLSRFRNIYELLNLPVKEINITDNAILREGKLLKIDCDPMFEECWIKVFKQYKKGDFLILKGALTRGMISNMNKFKIVVRDPSRIMLDSREMKKFFASENKIFVSNKPEMLFISLNTFNPDNFDIEPEAFYNEVVKIAGDHVIFNPMYGGELCSSVR